MYNYSHMKHASSILHRSLRLEDCHKSIDLSLEGLRCVQAISERLWNALLSIGSS